MVQLFDQFDVCLFPVVFVQYTAYSWRRPDNGQGLTISHWPHHWPLCTQLRLFRVNL